MKKIISQILLIVLIVAIGMTSVFITQVNAASIAGINTTSVTEGENFTVSLALPEGAFGANCNVEVTFSDGTKTTTGVGGETGIAFIKGMEAMGFANSITFKAKVAGETKIKVSSIVIVDANNAFLENGGSTEKTITIKSKTPPQEEQKPVTPPAEEQKPENTVKPSENKNTTSNNKVNNTVTPSTNTNTTTNTVTNTTNKNTVEKNEVKNPSFKDVNETVYAVKGCNVRSSCSTEISSNKIGGLVKGQSVKRTGVEKNWSRIEFNGKTAYVATNLLTTEKPVVENKVTENTVSNKVSNKVNNAIVGNTLSNKIDNDIVENNITHDNEISDDQILNQIEKEIGVLPEVGHNLATMMFVGISILTMIIIARLKYEEIE